ncbi:hypothetical protein Tco_0751788 [Tanacetum coccineum]|uniref:Uncharacterized protein n=1 Tax=Tanacetum coccineum TaxID=301880 RepID=A0ABQ4Z5V4_9ASTR
MQVQYALYNGHDIVNTNHTPAVVHDSEDTLEIAEKTRIGMLEKMKSTLWVDSKIKIAPPDYMRMEQYLTHIDYVLWEVIVNGDAPAVASPNAEGPIPPKTTEQKLTRKNELKAKSTLLLAIPDEHLLKFHGIKDAKTLWEAIKTKSGGNKESNKMQKTILKQQYENFTASRSEGLDKTYDRNKSDLDTMSMDDLYNNLKVYEAEIKGLTKRTLFGAAEKPLAPLWVAAGGGGGFGDDDDATVMMTWRWRWRWCGCDDGGSHGGVEDEARGPVDRGLIRVAGSVLELGGNSPKNSFPVGRR